MMLLAGKVALVTGGSRGIGRSIAIALAETGAHVALTYNVNQDWAEEVVESIAAQGGKAIAIQMTVEVGRNASTSW